MNLKSTVKAATITAAAAVLMISSALTAVSAQEYKWGNVVMGGGGFVSAIITSKTEPNLIYARTDVGGAYRWNESDKGWVSIMDWIGPLDTDLWGVDALALDPQNPSRVYLFAGTGYWAAKKTMILRSDDYGKTFEKFDVTDQFKTNGNGMGRQNGERLAVDPNNENILFLGTRDDGLWKSTNRGETWSKVTGAPSMVGGQSGNGICFVMFDGSKTSGSGASRVTSRIYIGLSRDTDNFYVSSDAGVTWTSSAFPVMSRKLMPQRAAITPGGKYLYVAAAAYAGPHGSNESRGALLRYDSESETWEDVSPENLVDNPPGDYGAYLGGVGGVSISMQDTNFIVASTINAWKPQIWDHDNKTKAHGDKIFASYDGGKNWTSVFGDVNDNYEPTGSEQHAVLYNNGYNWIVGESIHWTGSVEIDPFDSKRVFATSGNGVYMADNFTPGERFRFNFTVRGIEETVPIDVASIPGGPLITVIKDYDGFVHNDITKPVSGSRHTPRMGCTYGLDFAKLSPNIVVRAGGNNNGASNPTNYVFPLYYSTDTASTWKKFVTDPGNPGQNYRGKLAISSDGKVVLWTPQEKSTTYRTADWGATWTTSAGLTSQNPHVKADPVDPAFFYAFANGTVLVSSDTGKTFTAGGNTGVSWTKDLQVTPGVKGHVWVTGAGWDEKTLVDPVQGSLARSTDGGQTFHKVDPENDPKYTQKVQHSEAIGFGKAAPGADYPAIYIYGTINNKRGIWQSIDQVQSWTLISDDNRFYGELANGNFVRGDMNTFGVVYRSTAGRGIAARMPAEWVDGTSSIRPVRTGHKAYSPYARLRGQILTLTPPANSSLNVRVYDLKGRMVFNKTYTGATALRSRDMVKARGNYILSVRNAAKETVYNNRLIYTK